MQLQADSASENGLSGADDKRQIRMAFNSHGLGDVVHCATAMRLYINRGYDVAIQVEPNKRWIWEAAGVPIYDGPDLLPLHPYYYPDMRKYFDLSQPDFLYSKAAHLFEIEELPKLGTKEEVWKALCEVRLDASPHISPEAHAEAEAFLEGLPRPIFVLHSKGTNWQAEKSIPDGIAFELLFKLLETGGSVVVLDYDARVPVVTGHPRVRSIKAVGGGGWGHIDCDRLCALLARTDLFIGVDSGPFHVASLMTNVKCLGVFRKIPPVRCCLPSANATYLVPAGDHEHWESRGAEWRFVEYSMADVTAVDIAGAAISIVFPVKPDRPNATALGGGLMPDLPGRYVYRRVGFDERTMELLPDGRIGDGAGSCERVWKIERTPVGQVVTIYGEHGGPTCHLREDADGVLRGAWLAHEKMPIELIRDAGQIAPMCESLGHPSDFVPDADPHFYFGVLTYNRFDLLELALEAVLCSTLLPRKIYVVDNSCGKWPGHPSRRIEVIRPPFNLGVAAGFNLLQSLCQPHPLIVGADDVEVGPDLFEKMLACPEEMVFANESETYTVHMIRNEAWEKVGPWDVKFYPAYHEDNDYSMRAKLAGITTGCPASSGYKNHGPSATKAAMSDSERDALNGWFWKGRERYLAKWGGVPHLETFTVPFNGVPQ